MVRYSERARGPSNHRTVPRCKYLVLFVLSTTEMILLLETVCWTAAPASEASVAVDDTTEMSSSYRYSASLYMSLSIPFCFEAECGRRRCCWSVGGGVGYTRVR